MCNEGSNRSTGRDAPQNVRVLNPEPDPIHIVPFTTKWAKAGIVATAVAAFFTIIAATATCVLMWFAYEGLYNTLIPSVDLRNTKNKLAIAQDQLEKVSINFEIEEAALAAKLSEMEKDSKKKMGRIEQQIQHIENQRKAAEKKLEIAKADHDKQLIIFRKMISSKEQAIRDLEKTRQTQIATISELDDSIKQLGIQIQNANHDTVDSYLDIIFRITSINAAMIYDYLWAEHHEKELKKTGLVLLKSHNILLQILHGTIADALKQRDILTWKDIAVKVFEEYTKQISIETSLKDKIWQALDHILNSSREFSEPITFDPKSPDAEKIMKVTSDRIIDLSISTTRRKYRETFWPPPQKDKN